MYYSYEQDTFVATVGWLHYQEFEPPSVGSGPGESEYATSSTTDKHWYQHLVSTMAISLGAVTYGLLQTVAWHGISISMTWWYECFNSDYIKFISFQSESSWRLTTNQASNNTTHGDQSNHDRLIWSWLINSSWSNITQPTINPGISPCSNMKFPKWPATTPAPPDLKDEPVPPVTFEPKKKKPVIFMAFLRRVQSIKMDCK